MLSASCSAASSCRRRCAGRSGRSCAARPVTQRSAKSFLTVTGSAAPCPCCYPPITGLSVVASGSFLYADLVGRGGCRHCRLADTESTSRVRRSVCCGRLNPGLPMPRRMVRSLADGVHGDRRAAHPQRGLQRKVIQAGRDERTLLRLSRISIARCADLIRSSAYAWGPLSWSVHPVAAARATDQRPCAGDLRPGGAGSTAGLRREVADASWPSRRSRPLMPGGVLSGYPAWPVGGAASQRAGPATFRIGVSDDGARDLVRQQVAAEPPRACW